MGQTATLEQSNGTDETTEDSNEAGDGSTRCEASCARGAGASSLSSGVGTSGRCTSASAAPAARR